jgi:hypothetical protein
LRRATSERKSSLSVVVSAVALGLNAEMYEAVTGRVMPGGEGAPPAAEPEVNPVYKLITSRSV